MEPVDQSRESQQVPAPLPDDGDEPPPAPFVRMPKAEKKKLRAERAVERKHHWRERQKEAQHAATAARAAARAERLAALSEDERAAIEAAEREERNRIYHEKVAQTNRIEEALQNGLRVVLDLSYGGRMSAKEQTSLARQLSRCWGANRRAVKPVSLHLAGLGMCPSACLPPAEDVARWKVHRVTEDVSDAFPMERLVFLSPDADEPLTELHTDTTYVIGGLVDSSVQKHTSLAKAHDLGARTLRLPLAEHAPTANPRLPLTLTAVLEILLGVHAGLDWPSALRAAVAPRHLRPNSWENGRAARRQDARNRAAVSWGVQPRAPPPHAQAGTSGDGDGDSRGDGGDGSQGAGGDNGFEAEDTRDSASEGGESDAEGE